MCIVLLWLCPSGTVHAVAPPIVRDHNIYSVGAAPPKPKRPPAELINNKFDVPGKPQSFMQGLLGKVLCEWPAGIVLVMPCELGTM